MVNCVFRTHVNSKASWKVEGKLFRVSDDDNWWRDQVTSGSHKNQRYETDDGDCYSGPQIGAYK